MLKLFDDTNIRIEWNKAADNDSDRILQPYKGKELLKMQPYTGFATVYDLLMDHIPYDRWADYVERIFKEHRVEKGLVLELGCGTGNMTRRMADKGFDMIGLDSSEEMLSIARELSSEQDDGILYLCQDMRDFELYGTVAAVICVCDSINYMITEEDIRKVFGRVGNYLDPGGLFFFDMDTGYLYEEILGDNTTVMNREEGSVIWENTFYPEEMINEVNLTLFIRKEENLYQKKEETHVRKAYPVDTIRRLLFEAGMEMIAAYDELTQEDPNKESERIYILARERHHENKLYT